MILPASPTYDLACIGSGPADRRAAIQAAKLGKRVAVIEKNRSVGALAATSSEQGRLAACHAFGVQAGPMAPHFPVGIYAIPEISMAGPPEHDLTARKVPYEVG